MEHTITLMAASMLDSGRMTKRMEKVCFSKEMGILSMKDNG